MHTTSVPDLMNEIDRLRAHCDKVEIERDEWKRLAGEREDAHTQGYRECADLKRFEIDGLIKEAQTARLALDVALRALQRFRDREPFVKALVAAATRGAGKLHEYMHLNEAEELRTGLYPVRDFEIENPPPRAAPITLGTPGKSWAAADTKMFYADLSAFAPSPEFQAAIKKAMDQFNAWRCPKCGAAGRVYWPPPERDPFTFETASAHRVRVVCSKGCSHEPGAAT